MCLWRVVFLGELLLSAAVKMSSWCGGGGGKREGGEDKGKGLETGRRLVSDALPGETGRGPIGDGRVLCPCRHHPHPVPSTYDAHMREKASDSVGSEQADERDLSSRNETRVAAEADG